MFTGVKTNVILQAVKKNKKFLTLQSYTASPLIKMTAWRSGLRHCAKSPGGAFPLPPLDTLIINTYTALTPALENGNHTSCSSYLVRICAAQLGLIEGEILVQYSVTCCKPAHQKRAV